MRILVTDSDSRSALAAVRSLGRRGHEVVAAGVRRSSLAAASRFAAQCATYPDPMTDVPGFIETLVEIVRRERIDVVLPMTEVTTLLIAEHQQRLPNECRLPLPDHDAVANASNKAHVVTLAGELGVPTPRTIIVESADDGLRAANDLPYPVVVKPARSRVHVGSRWLSTSVSYAHDLAGLRQTLAALPASAYPVLLQERIQGPGVGLFACFNHDKPVALFAHRRIREKPPSGGVSVLCESTPLDPAAVEYATRLLSRVGWRGVAMVEFKRDRRDGSLRLMEINGRFWGSLQLAIDAGVDFPAVAVGVATGDGPSAPAAYRIGVRSRWLAGDLDALLMTLLRTRSSLNLPPSHPSRWRSLWDFMHLWGRDLRYEIERPDDLGPARLEWSRRFSRRS